MPDKNTNSTFVRMLKLFCQRRASTVMGPSDVRNLREFLLDHLRHRKLVPMVKGAPDWQQIADSCAIEVDVLRTSARVLAPGIDALRREIRRLGPLSNKRSPLSEWRKLDAATPQRPSKWMPERNLESVSDRQKRVDALPIIEFPAPSSETWTEPETFAEALDLHMNRHGDSARHLAKVLTLTGGNLDQQTIRVWRRGLKLPHTAQSFAALAQIERRYRLPPGYFRIKMPNTTRAPSASKLPGVAAAERRRLAWHLPDDFDLRPKAEREEILEWVQRVVISGATEYRQYQAAAMKHRYAISFPGMLGNMPKTRRAAIAVRESDSDALLPDPDLLCAVTDAPLQLSSEMADLIRFKTSTLTAFGYQRNGVWGEETASQKVEHLGLMFGALAASPRGAVHGFGVELQSLTFAMLVFPIVWDWYVQWRERRRGFFTAWEVDMLRVAIAITRKDTGWLRQSPHLAERLRPIPNLISEGDIIRAKADWAGTCDAVCSHALARAKEVQRVARIHRDPFEPILAILEADSPVAEYRRITEEILRRKPDERRYPRAAAESVRSFLLLRFGMHLGLRQKNLRQLLVCPRGHTPTPERQLADAKRGELRWSDRDQGWEVLIPSVAFKNANSSFFGSKPFRLVLPDLADLYHYIEEYIGRHRGVLLRDASDPRTFFVKTVKVTSKDAAYCQNTFYEAWRLAIQRYGIFNPYTGRGAIKGLLPHGPHNVRDVLATHILKKTGSYEQASYAIQDTPDMVAKHYGRFLPQDKAALAARILNQVWEAA